MGVLVDHGCSNGHEGGGAMRQVHGCGVFVLAGLVSLYAALGFGARAADTKDTLTEDELLFMDVPTVVTASRREQPANESPAAVWVVTAEDIKRSGATTIPEALRLVPGVDVVSIARRVQSVSVRGFFIDPVSTKLLVMVDGRSVGWDAYGTVLWNTMPVSIEEIDRIEVIASPASSLYGSTAYAGVIHILTKSPDDIEGPTIRLAVGEYRTLIGTALLGNRGERLSYRASFEIEQGDEVGGRREPAVDVRRGNVMLGYRFSERTEVSVSGGRVSLEEGKFFADEQVGTAELSGKVDHVQVDADIGSFSLRAFGKREELDASFASLDMTTAWFTWMADVELLHHLELGRISTLVSGASYRCNNVRSNAWIADDHSQHLFALFADDELRIGDKLRLSLGLRYDWHPLTESKLSPRGAISYLPSRNHTIRLGAGMAYRNPTFVESYLDLYIPPEKNPIGVPVPTAVQGSTDLQPQDIISVELSHRGAWTRSIASDINTFFRRYRNLYRLAQRAPIPAGDTTGAVYRQFVDTWDAFGCGGEAQVRYAPTDWVNVFGNYSLFYLGSTTSKSGAALDTATILRATPLHQANFGFEVQIVGFALSFYGQWRSSRDWQLTPGEGDGQGEVPAAFIMNCRAAYAFGNAEVSVAAFDLLDRRIFEYPHSDGSLAGSSYPLQQRVTVQLRCSF
ncbi:MAG: TonB-dependent receptor [Chitinivibrionales bacterium]|nr:TonB-dependent receptor [Chitinivibrionales bacterium]